MRCCWIAKILCACVLMTYGISLQGGDLKTVGASYTFYASAEMSVEQAKQTAFDRAVAKALADEFGMAVTQSAVTVICDTGGDTATKFIATGLSEVRGEWIETIGEPEYEINFSDGLLVVKVVVEGRAREIDFTKPMFSVATFRNDSHALSAATDFFDGDAINLGFEAPQSGFVAAYLVDGIGESACRLLPYALALNKPVAVEGGKYYNFFDRKKADNPSVVDELELTCGGLMELNDLYVIFSPAYFELPVIDVGIGYEVRTLPLKEFHRWLAASRTRNPDMQLKTIHITIKSKDK